MNKVLLLLSLFLFGNCSDEEEAGGNSLAQNIAIIEMDNLGVNPSFVHQFSILKIRSENFSVLAPISEGEKPDNFNIKQYIIAEELTRDFLKTNKQLTTVDGSVLHVTMDETDIYINGVKLVLIYKSGSCYIVTLEDFLE